MAQLLLASLVTVFFCLAWGLLAWYACLCVTDGLTWVLAWHRPAGFTTGETLVWAPCYTLGAFLAYGSAVVLPLGGLDRLFRVLAPFRRQLPHGATPPQPQTAWTEKE